MDEQKNYEVVDNYRNEEKIKFFRGQCLNIAGEIIATKTDLKNPEDEIFEMARKIFDKGIEKDFMNWR